MSVPTRRCRKCDVAWAGTLACWLCGADGDDKYTDAISIGPNLAADWDIAITDAAYLMWTGY